MKKYVTCIAVFILYILASLTWMHAMPTHASAEENCTIYLTFDDGPSDRITPKILDILKEKGVHGTFFVIGSHVEYRKELTKRIVEEGNSVGVHTYSHRYKKIYASTENLTEDVQKCADVLKKIGIRTNLYRFPGGSKMATEEQRNAVAEMGFVTVEWNALCGDSEWVNPTTAQLYKRAISSANDRKKIVMLFHDSTDKTATAEVLPRIIDYYLGKNYVFATFPMTA